MQDSNQSKLIVGLGNPSDEYENTRHNVGFSVLDSFGEKYSIQGKQEDKLLCWYGRKKVNINLNKKDPEGNKETFDIILAWPTTFMNKSGEAVVKLLNWFKLQPSDLILAHDDVALNLGKIRISFNSGAAGHHGIESVIDLLGVKEFIRLRIGVGPDPGGEERDKYVLEKFNKKEEKILKEVVNLSINALETIIVKDVGEAMNKFNGVELQL